ncbi:DMT family transporter [Dongia sp.]|uniref:DMT family transporter n=1 Tax=Dongia sp. TaxID=1977262 RepID=UPI0037516916
MRTRTQGYVVALLATTIFSAQDGISKHLAEAYSPIFVTMIRYWAFALFAVGFAVTLPGGIGTTLRTQRPWLQVFRGLLLVAQVVLAITSFQIAGLARTQAIFSATPLIVVVLAIPLLGEQVGWRRWTAIIVGLCGMLLIVRPEGSFFDPAVLLPVAGAINFAVYVVLTRMVGRVDSPMTSFFYTGVVGAAAISLAGPFFWANLAGWDLAWMAVLCLTSVSGHYLLIRAYAILDASAVQPITYLNVVYAAIIGMAVFDETIGWATVAGAIVIVGAGIFTIWREYVRRTPPPLAVAEAEHP